MTGIERIKEKITLDAEASARRVLDDAQVKKDAILADAAARRQASTAESDRRIETAKADQTRRSEAALHSEMRKQALAARQQVVRQAFDQAAEAIMNLPDSEYAALLSAMVLQTAWQGDAEIVVSHRDRGRLGDAWIRDIDGARAAAGLTGTTRFAADALPQVGGFVVRIGEMEINGTLPVLLDGIRPRLEAQVARTLFG